MSDDTRSAEDYARVVRDLRVLRERKMAAARTFSAAQRNLDDFYVRAKQEHVEDFETLQERLRYEVRVAQVCLTDINARERTLRQEKHRLHQAQVTRPEFESWPLTELVAELGRLQVRAQQIVRALHRSLESIDLAPQIADLTRLDKVRAQAAESTPEIGTLQPPPRRPAREKTA